eukprot:355796-Chlamydomonas_euryale.AAC.4
MRDAFAAFGAAQQKPGHVPAVAGAATQLRHGLFLYLPVKGRARHEPAPLGEPRRGSSHRSTFEPVRSAGRVGCSGPGVSDAPSARKRKRMESVWQRRAWSLRIACLASNLAATEAAPSLFASERAAGDTARPARSSCGSTAPKSHRNVRAGRRSKEAMGAAGAMLACAPQHTRRLPRVFAVVAATARKEAMSCYQMITSVNSSIYWSYQERTQRMGAQVLRVYARLSSRDQGRIMIVATEWIQGGYACVERCRKDGDQPQRERNCAVLMFEQGRPMQQQQTGGDRLSMIGLVWLRAGEPIGIAAGLGYLAHGFLVPRYSEASSEPLSSCKPSAAASTLALFFLT